MELLPLSSPLWYLELKIPLGSDFETLKPLLSKFMSYIISFIYVAIYWNKPSSFVSSDRKSERKNLVE